MQEDRKGTKGEVDGAGAAARKVARFDDFAELAGFVTPRSADDLAWQDGATRDPAFLLKNL